MRSNKFYRLLIVFIAVFVMSSVSALAVYAEEGTGTQNAFAVDALWNLSADEDVDISAEGMSVVMTKGETADYTYKMSLENLNLAFTFVDELTVTEESPVLTVTLTGTATNVVSYTKDEAGLYYAKLNDNAKVEVANNFGLTVTNGVLYASSEELGTLNQNDYDAVSLKLTAKENVTVKFTSMNGLDFTKAGLTYTDSNPVIVLNGSFFDRNKAVMGRVYDVVYTAYDMLSAVTTKVEFKKTDATEWTATKDSDEIEFPALGEYQVKVTALNAADVQTVSNVLTVNVVKASTEGSIGYVDNITKEQYAEYQEEVNKAIYDAEDKPLRIGSTFKVPSLQDFIVSEYFDYANLSFTTYYANKTSTGSYSSTSSTSFTLTSGGAYEFYVTAKDECGVQFTLETEDLTRKAVNEVYGWYDESDVLVCPIFTFEVQNTSAPEITVEDEVDAYVGVSYDVNFFTVEGYNVAKAYNLYYMTEAQYNAYKQEKGYALERSSFDNVDAVYWAEIDALVKDGKMIEVVASEVGEDPVDLFDEDKEEFTPADYGYYYVKLSVYDDTNMNDFAVSNAIHVVDKMSSAEFESEYFKNNWQSFLFLGIAALSLIGILLLVFVKPKEAVETTKEAKDAE